MLEPVTGIEPVLPRYKGGALPLDDTGMEPKRGIEPRSLLYERSGQPLVSAWQAHKGSHLTVTPY